MRREMLNATAHFIMLSVEVEAAAACAYGIRLLLPIASVDRAQEAQRKDMTVHALAPEILTQEFHPLP